MAFGNVGGDTSYYSAATPGAGGYKHGDRLPDGSNYIDPNIDVGAYNASKGWGGVTGEINSQQYTANPLAPAQYQNPDLSWIGGTTGGFGTGGTAPGNPYGPVVWGGLNNATASGSPQQPGGQTGGPPRMGGAQPPGGGYGGGQPGMRNPYLAQQGNDIWRRTQQGLDQSFNQIRSNAVGNGGLGGSRQGVAEGIAMRGAMDSYQGNMANLYGQSYQFDQGNDTARRGQDYSYNLGLTGAENQFYLGNRQLDQSQARLGADLYDMGQSRQLDTGRNIYDLGTQQQQAPWNTMNNAANIYNPNRGLNQQQTQQSGGGAQGAFGGAVAGAQYAADRGWWGGQTNAPTSGGYYDPNYDYTNEYWYK